MTFRPLHDRVLVRRIAAQPTTAGGIVIPETVQEKQREGEVVAAGAGRRDEDGAIKPLDVEIGDHILFTNGSGSEIEIGGETLIIMKESDVFGISN
jgi:chaperonin GroES